MKKAKEMSALEVSRLADPGVYAVGVVPGLQLQIIGAAKSWVLRARIGGKRRRMGLGSYPAVTLAQARDKARQAHSRIDEGTDPILDRQRAKSALRSAQAKAITFAQASQMFLDAKGDEWRNAKHRQQWTNTLTTYAFPELGKLLVSDVEQAQVLAVLTPIWRTKTETATRVRGRIEQILDWAAVRGYRSGENPARWRGRLDKLLPKPKKISKVVHHPAVSVAELQNFMQALRKREGLSARALEFQILTAARSGEVRGAAWAEIDLEAAVWTVPANRMKAGKEHRVPLSSQAIAVLRALPRLQQSDCVFVAPRGGALSDMSLTAVMRRMERVEVPHGFRSTFRDWAAERTNFPSEVIEMALAHAIENKVEAAYRRGDLLAKRTKLMQTWANFCDSQGVGTVAVLERTAA